MLAVQVSKHFKSVTRLHGLPFTTDSSTFTRAVAVILTDIPFRCTLGMVLIKLTRCHSSNKYLQIGIFLPVMGEKHSRHSQKNFLANSFWCFCFWPSLLSNYSLLDKPLLSIQPFHTSNGSGLWFNWQQMILSLVLSLALCDFLAKVGFFFVNKCFFSEVLFSFVQTGTAQRGCSLGFFSNLLCTKHRHLLGHSSVPWERCAVPTCSVSSHFQQKARQVAYCWLQFLFSWLVGTQVYQQTEQNLL